MNVALATAGALSASPRLLSAGDQPQLADWLSHMQTLSLDSGKGEVIVTSMTTYERAIQIYQALIAAAHHRQTITYKMLGDAIDLPEWTLGNHLEHLQRYCARNGLPPLTALVVHTGQGVPGSGHNASADPDADREQVYAHEWFKDRPLTVAVLQQE